VKTGTGSSFRRHFGENPIFWGQYLGCYGGYEADIWGRILHLGTSYSGEISRSWLKGVIYLSGESFLAFVALSPMSGAAAGPQLDPCAQYFSGVRYYALEATKLESGLSGPFSFGDMNA